MLLPAAAFTQGRPQSGKLPPGSEFIQPGDAPSWPELKKAYDVPSKDPEVKEEDRKSLSALSIHIILTGPRGEKVPGGFLRPKAEGQYPAILLLHGLTSDKDAMLKSYGISLVQHGFAVLALDAPFHGERKSKDPDISAADTGNFAEAVREGTREYRKALDWLCARKDIDAHRIGALGYSMGAMMTVILAAVDDRVSDTVLCVGGDPIISFAPNIPEGKRDAMYSICPTLFADHISPRRVLMLNARIDDVMPATAALRLYDAFKQPKLLEWYDTNHILPAAALNRAVGWLTDKLNPAPVN